MGNRQRVATQEDIDRTFARIKHLRNHCEACRVIGNPQFRHFRLMFFMEKLFGWFDENLDF